MKTQFKVVRTLSIAACAALVAGQTFAQTPAQKKSDGKLTIVDAQDLDDAQSSAHSVEVRIVDGDVTVKRDGKEVPKDRIKRENGRIIILDENGKELKDFTIGVPRFDGGEFRLFGGGQNPWRGFATEGAEMPKVMLGVHMGEPSAELEYHLGLEHGKSAIISGLFEGLPAYEAGIRQHDVIVKVDGKEPADAATIKQAVAEKDVDETITFTVIQKGRERDVKVRLAAFDAEKMQSSKLIGQDSSPQVWSWVNPQGQFGVMELPQMKELFENQDFFVVPGHDGHKHMEMIAPRIQEKLRQHAAQGGGDEDNVNDQLDKLDKRMAELEAMLQKLIERQERGAR